MVNDDVFLADRRETVAVLLAHALGEARLMRFETKLGPIDADKLVEGELKSYDMIQQAMDVNQQFFQE